MNNCKLLGLLDTKGYEKIQRVYSGGGISPAMTVGGDPPQIVEIKKMEDKKSGKFLVKQATKDGFIEYFVGGGTRHELPIKQDQKRKSPRRREDKSNTDNGEYP